MISAVQLKGWEAKKHVGSVLNCPDVSDCRVQLCLLPPDLNKAKHVDAAFSSSYTTFLEKSEFQMVMLSLRLTKLKVWLLMSVLCVAVAAFELF